MDDDGCAGNQDAAALARREGPGVRRGRESSILAADLDRFDELRYFDADPVLRVEPFESIDLIERDTSQGEPATYESFGRLGFELDGTACQLTVY